MQDGVFGNVSSDQWAQIVPGAAVLLSWSFKAGADVLPQTPDAHECALWRTCPAPSTPSGVDCRFAVEFSAPMLSPQSQAEPIGMGGRQCISNEFARVSVRCAGYMPCNMPKTMYPSPNSQQALTCFLPRDVLAFLRTHKLTRSFHDRMSMRSRLPSFRMM